MPTAFEPPMTSNVQRSKSWQNVAKTWQRKTLTGADNKSRKTYNLFF
jgi:hypothetical protein